MPFPPLYLPLFEDIMFEVWHRLIPATDVDVWAVRSYRKLVWGNEGIEAPPERIKLVLRRYFEFPEFYVGFAARSLAWLPEDDELAITLRQENDAMLAYLETHLVRVSVVPGFPLMLWAGFDPATFAEVQLTFNLQFEHEVSVYPILATAEFDFYYWILGAVARTMFLAYLADQLARVFQRGAIRGAIES